MRLLVPPALAGVLAAAALAAGAPAGALAAAAPAGPAAAHLTAAPHTVRAVVRPVDSRGHAAAGWTVHRQRGVSVQCDGSSPAAVSRDIVECFPTAEYLPACWRSGHHTVLCLRDARNRTLVRVRYTGTVPQVSAPRHPSPLDLRLPHQACSLRIGGAWGTLPSHPAWLGFYSCDRGSVYGPPSGDGIDRSHQPWTVHVVKRGTKQRVVVRRVRTAYVVGTRH